MDKESLPRWAWLLAALIVAAIVSQLINLVLLHPIGLSEEFEVVTTITLMSPVLIYVGIWYDEHRQEYWERSRGQIAGDVLFVLVGALLGSATVLAMIVDTGWSRLILDIVAMFAGFVTGWALFWWRNTELYRDESGTR
ncbi:hypothetical protein OB955_16775 [Halobacteria archaeon AArc-m2/3/4]|uniref:Uncharacterized protein n=1 Tax=Natronoglomus mannanivorans TaxID=2979990 RepID=A0ABT2QHI3_9EURY|nr:hypothetical protein [Halobacteria archaeon AArc-m2/3/4]